jgi:nitrate reductase gamma subunit
VRTLLASQEVWLCYYCGECSETCPRQAEPGEFMASARRYAIASLDPTGLSRLLYTSTLFTVIFLAGLSLLLGAIFLWQSGPMNLERPDLFAFIPFETVHDVGLAAILVALLAMAFGIVRLLRLLRTRGERTIGLLPAIRAVAEELVTEKRYRTCTEEQHAPWYRSRWLMHWAIMWGFLGLAAATAFDYLLMLLSGKVPGQAVPLWQPTRLLGTLAGMLILFGTARALIFRITKPEKYSSHSLASDWLFLWLLLIGTVSGFIVELAPYLPRGAIWEYVLFLLHVIIGMEIVLLFPFTKFAHAVYRPLALVLQELRATRR